MDDDGRLDRARAAFERRAWGDARDDLLTADEDTGLGVDDLERLGVAAHLSGDPEMATTTLERLHHALLDAGEADRAARWAVWLAILLSQSGQHARGGGWLSRARRVVDEGGQDGPARGYLLVPAALQRLDAELDPAGALALFAEVSDTARRFDDPDLAVIGLLGQGQSLVAAGDVDRGLPLLDEVMVAVTTGGVSPIMAGMAYCAVILACREVFDLRRAREWTGVLSQWCDDQQDLHPYQGQCLVHRSEIMQLHGRWAAAMDEIEQACDHLARIPGDPVMGMARYQQGELLRLRGEVERAGEAYRLAEMWGHSPQPGLALLRLDEGRVEDALVEIRRTADERQGDRVRRARVLGALVEIALAAGEVDEAAAAVAELEAIAADLDSTYLRAVADEGRGAVLLARTAPADAIPVLRRAWRSWQALAAPYDAARVRVRIARASRAVGDDDTAAAELDAARTTFEDLGAAPALAGATAFADVGTRRPGGLTPREVEVLRLVATGATNREVAEALVISDKTVARHLSNMFTKLDVGSRAAATAWAYEHDVV